MSIDQYALTTAADRLTYEFLSEGPNGTIKKVVLFELIDSTNQVFNLAFGDWDEINQKPVDSVRTNNKDRDKVLATVAATVVEFIQHYPNAAVFATGSTPSRTRLYQMGLNQHWNKINRLFIIQGHVNGQWETFRKGINYKAFLLKAR